MPNYIHYQSIQPHTGQTLWSLTNPARKQPAKKHAHNRPDYRLHGERQRQQPNPTRAQSPSHQRINTDPQMRPSRGSGHSGCLHPDLQRTSKQPSRSEACGNNIHPSPKPSRGNPPQARPMIGISASAKAKAIAYRQTRDERPAIPRLIAVTNVSIPSANTRPIVGSMFSNPPPPGLSCFIAEFSSVLV